MPGVSVGHGPGTEDAPVTDQKTSPDDERVYTEDKMRVAQTETDDKESLIPKTHENPALEDLRRKRDEAAGG
jgi:hypothetical protein